MNYLNGVTVQVWDFVLIFVTNFPAVMLSMSEMVLSNMQVLFLLKNRCSDGFRENQPG